MPTVPARAPLFAALLLYFVLVVALIATVPWGSAPDEGAHADYIQAIATTHALPVFQGQAPPALGYEFHQPPLYYLVAAPLYGIHHYSARLLSLVSGLLTVWVIWNAANLLFGRGSRASAFCAFGAALSPLHQGVGASVNNDALAGLWSACLFYLVARVWLETPTKRLLLLLGAVAGLGALTKLTALPLGLWAFIAVAVALSRRGERPIPALLPALIIALVLSAPMLIRNQLLYGDPFAYGLFSRAATQTTPGFPLFGAAGLPFTTYARGMVWQMLGTAWGFLGGSDTFSKLTGPLSASGPHFPDPLLLVPFSVTVAVPLLGIWSAWKSSGTAAPTESKAPVASTSVVETSRTTDYSPDLRSLSLWWGMGVLLLVVLWANFAYAHFSGGQARYLHGALLPVTLLVAGGLSRSRGGFFAALLLALTMLGLTLANILFWKTLV